jgi:hypothetical protein
VALEERLAAPDGSLSACGEPAGPVKQPPQPIAADQIAKIVAKNRGRRGDRDHERQRQLTPRRERTGNDHRGFARHKRPG